MDRGRPTATEKMARALDAFGVSNLDVTDAGWQLEQLPSNEAKDERLP